MDSRWEPAASSCCRAMRSGLDWPTFGTGCVAAASGPGKASKSRSGLHPLTIRSIKRVSFQISAFESRFWLAVRLPMRHSRFPSKSHQSSTLPWLSIAPLILMSGNGRVRAGTGSWTTTFTIPMAVAAATGKNTKNRSGPWTTSTRFSGRTRYKPGKTRISEPSNFVSWLYCA